MSAKNINNKKQQQVHSNRCEPNVFGMDMDIKDEFVDPFNNFEQRMYKTKTSRKTQPILDYFPKKNKTQEMNQKNNQKENRKKTKKMVLLFQEYIAVPTIIQMDNHIKNVINLNQ